MGYPFPPTRVGKSRRPFRLKRSIRQAHDEVVPLHVPLHWSNATWWLIPLSKWVTTLVINRISGVSPLISGGITRLLSGMNHQVLLDADCLFPQYVNFIGISTMDPNGGFLRRRATPSHHPFRTMGFSHINQACWGYTSIYGNPQIRKKSQN